MDKAFVAFTFEDKEFKILGSEQQPLFTCSDIIVKLLGYKEINYAAWYRYMDEELRNIYTVELDDPENTVCFNEIGLHFAVIKANMTSATLFLKNVTDILANARNYTKEPTTERKGEIYYHTVYRDGDPLDGKIINVGQTLDHARRFLEYEREVDTLISAYKGREMIVSMAHFKINGYEIVGQLLEKDIPQSDLRDKEAQYQEQYETLNCPRQRHKMIQDREKAKCDICNKEVYPQGMVSHKASQRCKREGLSTA